MISAQTYAGTIAGHDCRHGKLKLAEARSTLALPTFGYVITGTAH
jgi:hypothetical protein